MKKALLFTIMTLILLSSVFLLSSSYLRRNRQMQDFVSQGARSNDIRFVTSDIVSDYFSILNIELDEIKRGGSTVEIKFSNFSTLKNGQNYSSKLSSYENFVTTTYADLTNKNINVVNFNAKFYFYPYNSTFLVNDESFYLYFVSYKKLQETSIRIKLNESNSSVLLKTSPADEGGTNPLIKVVILDKNNLVITNKSIRLNTTKLHIPFFILFNKGSYFPTFTLNFGNKTIFNFFGPSVENNGTLYMSETKLTAYIKSLSAKYNSVNKTTILQTDATIDVS
jgi:hypothetical protein